VKNYLNQQERELVGLTLVLLDRLKEFKNNGEERRAMMSAIRFYNTFFKRLLGRVGSSTGQKIINDMRGCSVSFKTLGARPESKDTIEIDREVIEDLAEGVIEGHCRKCTGKEVCNIRELFLASEIPVFTELSHCPYDPN
jgi:hypothetical protein